MSSTGLDVFDRAVQKANLWLGELMDELGWDGRHQALEALKTVLHVIRDRLPVQDAVDLGAQLPTLLRGFYYQNWVVSKTPERYRHLDDFFDRLRVNLAPHRIDTPLEPLVQAVINLLARRLTEGELKSIRRALPQELRVLWQVHGLPDERPAHPLPDWYVEERREARWPDEP
jgi:uncharacterized protein (DUF2267 family)